MASNINSFLSSLPGVEIKLSASSSQQAASSLQQTSQQVGTSSQLPSEQAAASSQQPETAFSQPWSRFVSVQQFASLQQTASMQQFASLQQFASSQLFASSKQTATLQPAESSQQTASSSSSSQQARATSSQPTTSSTQPSSPSSSESFFPSGKVAINDWLKKTIQKVYDQLSDDNDEDDEDGDGNGDTSSNGDDEVDANNDEDLNGAFQVQQSESHRQSSKAQINVNDSSSSSSSPPSIATKSTNPTISYCLPATQTNKADLPRLVKPESEQPEDTKKSMGRKSAQEAWSIAHKEPIVAALESIYQKCNKTCHLTGNCASGVNGEEILKLRKAFHGEKRDDAPKDKQRAEIILKYFEEATKDAKDNLSFKIGSKLVCLPTLLRFLGVTRSPDIRDAPRQWTRLQKGFLSTKDKETLLSAKELKIDAEERYHNKAGKCTRFIDEYCTFFSDCIPIALAEDENGEPVSTVVVPFRTIADFYAEYVFYSQSKDPPVLEQDMAGITVFSTAWKDAFNKKIVKFMGGKSGIPTCATCNNMKQIKTSACCKRDEITRKVLIKLARLHLLQQKAERQHAENFIEAAGKLNVDGQPELAYADIDGQSVWTGNSPRMKIGGRSIKFDKVIENRNIGVRIVCGPIDEYISICTNNLIPGGANVLVEVTRYTIGYIARRLAEFGMIMPKKIGFQFDNSGENKNKEMFCFLSECVEECYFSSVELFFLLVGHTHNILDQWFGVLSTAISKSNFIGSWMAIQEIYKIAHSDKHKARRPKEVHQLQFYHDWRKRYSRVMNQMIHNYSIPLRWRITLDKLLNVAKCDYQVVSPTAGFTHLERWQPESSQVFEGRVDGTVEIELFDTLGGVEAVYDAAGMSIRSNHSNVDMLNQFAVSDKGSEQLVNAGHVLPVIRELECRSIGEQRVRFIREADEARPRDAEIERADEHLVQMSAETVKAIFKEITDTNTEKGGRIVWLRRSQITDDPEQLQRRPDILPNPQLWRDTLAAYAARDSALASVNDKKPEDVVSADQRLTQFRGSALEMVSAATHILHMIDVTKQITESESTDIAEATSHFNRPVLTKREVQWYRSINTVDKIDKLQQHVARVALETPWQLLDIPEETVEEKKDREQRLQQKALLRAQTEARLRRVLLRQGEGEYDPNLQVVSMDGFRPATSNDVNDMLRAKLEELAKQGGMKTKDIKALKVEQLRTAVKRLIEEQPNLIQIPGVEIIVAPDDAAAPVAAEPEAAAPVAAAAEAAAPAAAQAGAPVAAQAAAAAFQTAAPIQVAPAPPVGAIVHGPVVAGTSNDINDMLRAKLEELAKQGGMKTKDIKALKVEQLRTAVKRLIEEQPNLIQIPGVEIIVAPDDAAAPVAAAAAVHEDNTATTVTSAECGVLDCEDAVSSLCGYCKLSFCTFHETHLHHSLQTLKAGLSSASDWNTDSRNAAVIRDQEAPIIRAARAKRKAISGTEDGTEPIAEGGIAMPPAINTVANKRPKSPNIDVDLRIRATGSRILEGDNADHRKIIIQAKLKDAIDFITSSRAAGNATHAIFFDKFKYQSAFDIEFLCMLGANFDADLSRVTSKSRYTHKDLLNELISKLL